MLETDVFVVGFSYLVGIYIYGFLKIQCHSTECVHTGRLLDEIDDAGYWLHTHAPHSE